MSPPIRTAKATLREQMRARLKGISPAERQTASARLNRRLQEQSIWQTARSILFFASMPEELDLWPSVEAALAFGKLVCLPRWIPGEDAYASAQVRDLQHDLVSGRMGIREPAAHCAGLPLNRLDLILVPGLSFDLSGHRLGRGKGYYDRWLTAPCGLTCGVAFDEQLVDAVPVEPHDATVDCILTPSRWIEVSPRRAATD